jgi:hypothetical protein
VLPEDFALIVSNDFILHRRKMEFLSSASAHIKTTMDNYSVSFKACEKL